MPLWAVRKAGCPPRLQGAPALAQLRILGPKLRKTAVDPGSSAPQAPPGPPGLGVQAHYLSPLLPIPTARGAACPWGTLPFPPGPSNQAPEVSRAVTLPRQPTGAIPPLLTWWEALRSGSLPLGPPRQSWHESAHGGFTPAQNEGGAVVQVGMDGHQRRPRAPCPGQLAGSQAPMRPGPGGGRRL